MAGVIRTQGEPASVQGRPMNWKEPSAGGPVSWKEPGASRSVRPRGERWEKGASPRETRGPVGHWSNRVAAWLVPLLLLTACMGGGGAPSDGSGPAGPTMEIDALLPHKVAILPFANNSPDPEAGAVVRRLFFNFFSALNYYDVELAEVDRQLRAQGLMEGVVAGEAAVLARACQFLGVDGLIQGEVRDFGKMYAVIYAHQEVTLQARLIHCDGLKTVWSDAQTRTDREGGLGLDITGMAISLIKTFISHQNASVLRTAVDLCMGMLATMPNPLQLSHPPPEISLMVHNGVGRFIAPGRSLRVVLIGEAGARGSWDPTPEITGLPLEERSPGVYVGSYTVQSGDRAFGVMPTARLTNASGGVNRWLDVLGGVNLGQPSQLPAVIAESRVLTAAAGPYLVGNHLLVQPGAVLTIEAGANLWIAGRGVVIRGGLQVHGEADNPVTLGPLDAETPWRGLFFDHAEGVVQLDWLQVRGARFGVNARDSEIVINHARFQDNGWGVVVAGGGIELNHSHIRNSEKTGLALRDARAEARGNVITENAGGGVLARDADLTLTGNNIFGNGPWEISREGEGPPLAVPGNWWGDPDASQVVVSGTVILEPVLTEPVALGGATGAPP